MLSHFWLTIYVELWNIGHDRDPLEWSARQKIAVGAARGLRYLHEECRVGCIVHRDMRPNNILLTHDFEPLVRFYPSFSPLKWGLSIAQSVNQRIYQCCFIFIMNCRI